MGVCSGREILPWIHFSEQSTQRRSFTTIAIKNIVTSTLITITTYCIWCFSENQTHLDYRINSPRSIDFAFFNFAFLFLAPNNMIHWFGPSGLQIQGSQSLPISPHQSPLQLWDPFVLTAVEIRRLQWGWWKGRNPSAEHILYFRRRISSSPIPPPHSSLQTCMV